MRRTYQYIFLLAMGAMLFASCKKFLTLQPEDRFTENQVFSSEISIQQALNGLYRNMAGSALYGSSLSNTTTEILGQRYNFPNSGSGTMYMYYLMRSFSFTQQPVKDEFERIWKAGYAAIQKADNFAVGIDVAVAKGVISAEKAKVMKGEAIAIRAMVHFDLLRLFGPIYSKSPDAPAIPYYRLADAKSRPILTAKQVMDSVITDLQESVSLLANDPVSVKGIKYVDEFYDGYRNQRLNYYAVKALMARAYLYGGNKTAAHDTAQAVLAEGEKWFPWTTYDAIVTQKLNPDRVFSSEVLFGVYNQDLYSNYTAMFSPNLQDVAILAPLPGRLEATYERNENDYRYPNVFLVGGAKTYRTFYKYADVSAPTTPWRFLQPLIRKTELYYIIAETETDQGKALELLNTVRFNRGLTPLAAGTAVLPEITKEYQKEFWGEGQLYFYFKRQNTTAIPSGVNATSNITAVYTMTLPLSETTPR